MCFQISVDYVKKQPEMQERVRTYSKFSIYENIFINLVSDAHVHHERHWRADIHALLKQMCHHVATPMRSDIRKQHIVAVEATVCSCSYATGRLLESIGVQGGPVFLTLPHLPALPHARSAPPAGDRQEQSYRRHHNTQRPHGVQHCSKDYVTNRRRL